MIKVKLAKNRTYISFHWNKEFETGDIFMDHGNFHIFCLPKWIVNIISKND